MAAFLVRGLAGFTSNASNVAHRNKEAEGASVMRLSAWTTNRRHETKRIQATVAIIKKGGGHSKFRVYSTNGYWLCEPEKPNGNQSGKEVQETHEDLVHGTEPENSFNQSGQPQLTEEKISNEKSDKVAQDEKEGSSEDSTSESLPENEGMKPPSFKGPGFLVEILEETKNKRRNKGTRTFAQFFPSANQPTFKFDFRNSSLEGSGYSSARKDATVLRIIMNNLKDILKRQQQEAQVFIITYILIMLIAVMLFSSRIFPFYLNPELVQIDLSKLLPALRGC